MKKRWNRFRTEARLHIIIKIKKKIELSDGEEKEIEDLKHFYDVGVLAIEGNHPITSLISELNSKENLITDYHLQLKQLKENFRDFLRIS